MLNLLLSILQFLFQRKPKPPTLSLVPNEPEAPKESKPSLPLPIQDNFPEAAIAVPSSIDWTNPEARISKYFKVKEACYFPRWKRLATEADGLTAEVKNNLITTFQTMDKIREYFNKPIKVTIAFRSPEYNALIGGAKRSMHLVGKAVDFIVQEMNCDEVRKQLLPKLEDFNIRLEDLPGANWTHIDTKQVPNNLRYFKP